VTIVVTIVTILSTYYLPSDSTTYAVALCPSVRPSVCHNG